MAKFSKVKYMPLSQYSSGNDTEDTICAVDVSNILGNGLFPDWSKKVAMSSNTTYTVGSGALANYKAGYVWCGSPNWTYSTCNINGTTFVAGGWFTEDGHDRKLLFFPVSTGDYMSSSGSANFIFIPIAGGL